MAIIYDPNKMLAKAAPPAKIKKMVRGNMTLNKAALNFVDSFDFIDKKAVSTVALKTIKAYKARVKDESIEASDLKKDPAQLIQRVQNAVIYQVATEIKTQYKGEQYEWLPSDAEEPDPEHQLNYGKIFVVGEQEDPGERYGCRCGMRILVNETELKLE